MGEVTSAIARAIDVPESDWVAGRGDHKPLTLVGTGTRRHRPLTGTAGILLFICMFLPALRGCGASTITPLDAPPFLPPYLYGLAFAALAMARTPRHLLAGVVALRLLATVVAFAGFVVFLVAPSIGIVELFVGLALIATIGLDGVSEARVALTALILGLVSVAWFGLWCTSEDVLIGVQLSLASSIALTAGSLVWLHEVWTSPPISVPRAVLRYARAHEGTARRAAVRSRM